MATGKIRKPNSPDDGGKLGNPEHPASSGGGGLGQPEHPAVVINLTVNIGSTSGDPLGNKEHPATTPGATGTTKTGNA